MVCAWVNDAHIVACLEYQVNQQARAQYDSPFSLGSVLRGCAAVNCVGRVLVRTIYMYGRPVCHESEMKRVHIDTSSVS